MIAGLAKVVAAAMKNPFVNQWLRESDREEYRLIPGNGDMNEHAHWLIKTQDEERKYRALIEEVGNHRHRHKLFSVSVMTREQGSEPVVKIAGRALLKNIEPTGESDRYRAELSILISDEYRRGIHQGAGYGRQVVEQLLHYAFNDSSNYWNSVDEVWLGTYSDNIPMIRVAEHCGFEPFEPSDFDTEQPMDNVERFDGSTGRTTIVHDVNGAFFRITKEGYFKRKGSAQ